MMKRSLLVIGFLPLLAVNLQAMQEKFISVAQARQNLERAERRLRTGLEEANKQLSRTSAKEYDAAFAKIKRDILGPDLMAAQGALEAYGRSSTEIKNNASVQEAYQSLKGAVGFYEAFGKFISRPGEGGETDRPARYTMDFEGAKKIAGEIKQQLATVSAAGKTLSSAQKSELNVAAGISLF
jgi:hypothetical protein